MKHMHFLLAALTTTLLAVPLHAEAGWGGHGKGTKTYKTSKSHSTYKADKAAKWHSYKAEKAARWEAHKAAKADRLKQWHDSITAYKARKAEMWSNWLASKKAHKSSKSVVVTHSKTKTWDKSWKRHKKAYKTK